MRTTTKTFKRISVTEEVYNRLKKDREHFQKVIGGGKWSLSDTITEYLKIINTKKGETTAEPKAMKHKKK
jgi:predicted CopG family antitoxin